jgi:hypothetical protein
MSCEPAITRFLWWLVNSSAQMLESGEREAVRGDLTESGETGSHALRHVLGLVIRRQVSIWTDWRPWLTLVGLVVPLGLLLSVVSRRMAATSAVYIWMYANNLDPNLFRYRGFWYQLGDTVAEIFKMYLSLGCWSWTTGFVLGSAWRGIVRINGFLLGLMLAFGVLLGAPLYSAYYEHYLHLAIGFRLLAHQHQQHDPVNALIFYRVMFPLIVQAVLVLLPALWGMREGARAVRFRLLLRAILWTAAFAALVAVVIQDPDLWMFLKLFRLVGTSWHGWQGGLLQLLAYWPLMFMLAIAITRRLQGGRVVSHSVLP